MNHQLESAAVAETNGREVPHVARCEPPNAEQLRKRHDRAIDQAESEIGKAPIHLHRT